jgi:hypothetical protein
MEGRIASGTVCLDVKESCFVKKTAGAVAPDPLIFRLAISRPTELTTGYAAERRAGGVFNIMLVEICRRIGPTSTSI